jgi:hypothetical protein
MVSMLATAEAMQRDPPVARTQAGAARARAEGRTPSRPRKRTTSSARRWSKPISAAAASAPWRGRMRCLGQPCWVLETEIEDGLKNCARSEKSASMASNPAMSAILKAIAREAMKPIASMVKQSFFHLNEAAGLATFVEVIGRLKIEPTELGRILQAVIGAERRLCARFKVVASTRVSVTRTPASSRYAFKRQVGKRRERRWVQPLSMRSTVAPTLVAALPGPSACSS